MVSTTLTEIWTYFEVANFRTVSVNKILVFDGVTFLSFVATLFLAAS